MPLEPSRVMSLGYNVEYLTPHCIKIAQAACFIRLQVATTARAASQEVLRETHGIPFPGGEAKTGQIAEVAPGAPGRATCSASRQAALPSHDKIAPMNDASLRRVRERPDSALRVVLRAPRPTRAQAGEAYFALAMEAILHFDRGTHRVDHAAELDDCAVASALDDATMMGGDGWVDEVAAQAPDACQRTVLVSAGEPAVADNIRDQDGRELAGLAHCAPR